MYLVFLFPLPPCILSFPLTSSYICILLSSLHLLQSLLFCLIHHHSFSALVSPILIPPDLPLTQSPAAPPAVRRAGAMGRRANPRTMRSSLSPANKATPAPPLRPNPPPSPPPPPRWRPTSWVLAGRPWTRQGRRLTPLPLLTPTPLLAPPRPQTCWGTCLGPRPRRPVQHLLLSPHRTKWWPTGLLPAPRPHQQVISTQQDISGGAFCYDFTVLRLSVSRYTLFKL